MRADKGAGPAMKDSETSGTTHEASSVETLRGWLALSMLYSYREDDTPDDKIGNLFRNMLNSNQGPEIKGMVQTGLPRSEHVFEKRLDGGSIVKICRVAAGRYQEKHPVVKEHFACW